MTPESCCAYPYPWDIGCDVKYIDWNSDACLPYIKQYCSGSDKWQDWNPMKNCYHITSSVVNLINKNSIILDAITTWEKDVGTLGIKTTDQNAQTVLSIYLEFCAASAGLCDIILNDICKLISRDEVSHAANDTSILMNRNIISACGCHLADFNYEHQKGIIDEDQLKTCDSICVLQYTVPPKIISCEQTNCIIDDIVINILNSSVDTISFNQICSGCIGEKCKCYFDGISIYSTASNIDHLQFTQNCDECYIFDKNTPGLITKVQCSGSNIGTFKTWVKNNSDYLLFVLCIILVFIIIIMLFGY